MSLTGNKSDGNVDIIFSSEVWVNVTKDLYKKMEEIDEMYLRQILNLQRTVVKESLCILCGKIPIRIIIKMRRLMYWWHLLHCDKNELIFKCYTAQKLNPEKNDWVKFIFHDKIDLKIQLTDEDVMNMSKQCFKTLV